MDNLMVECKHLSFWYSSNDSDTKNIVMRDINIEINKGDFIVVLGSNGSGKSTLAKHMNALLVPCEGEVYIENMNTRDENNLWNIRNKAGMVFQNPDNQIVATIVEDDVAFGPENLGVESNEIRKRVDQALKNVDMYDYRMNAPHLLSGGQKQRVAIAGILAMRPDCIILDEPTAMLDPSGRKEVINTVKYLNDKYGMTIVLITHYMEEAIDADKIVIVDHGKVVKTGTPRDIFSDVEMMKEAGLDVPQMTELAYLLKKSGLKIDTNILTIDEMVNALCQLK